MLTVCLDFFVDPLARWAGREPARLSDDHHRVWLPKYVRAMLEERLGLSTAAPVPGRVVAPHEGPFALWEEALAAGALTAPFDLVQLDAHGNLGSTDEGWFHVLGRLAHLPVEKRAQAEARRVTPENYLLFALARRWLASLTLVAHPAWEPDVLPLLHENADPGRGRLQLRAYDPHVLERILEEAPAGALPAPVAADEPVPFEIVPGPGYRTDRPFDFVTVVHAPAYTPPGADALLPVLGEYVRPFQSRDERG